MIPLMREFTPLVTIGGNAINSLIDRIQGSHHVAGLHQLHHLPRPDRPRGLQDIRHGGRGLAIAGIGNLFRAISPLLPSFEHDVDNPGQGL